MKALNGYKEAKTYSERKALPLGSYAAKILGVKYEAATKEGNSDMIKLRFDLTDGEFKGFYQQDYDNNTSDDKKWRGTITLWVPKDDGSERDGWTLRAFKTAMTNIEASNPGYVWDWDENKLVGKVCGINYHEKEWEMNGKTGMAVVPHSVIALDQVGKVKPGKAKYLNGSAPKTSAGNDDFVNVPEGVSDEIPF